MSQELNVKIPFQVRQMSSGSFALVSLYFIIAFFLLTLIIFYSSNINIVILCVVFTALGIYNASVKHKNDKIFIEIDAMGIWVHDKEVTDWSNYKGAYITVKFDDDYDNYNSNFIGRNANRVLQRVINIEHYKNGQSGYFIHQLLFNGSEDKVEEEVIDAIEFYYNNRIPLSRFNIR